MRVINLLLNAMFALSLMAVVLAASGGLGAFSQQKPQARVQPEDSMPSSVSAATEAAQPAIGMSPAASASKAAPQPAEQAAASQAASPTDASIRR